MRKESTNDLGNCMLEAEMQRNVILQPLK